MVGADLTPQWLERVKLEALHFSTLVGTFSCRAIASYNLSIGLVAFF